MNDLINRLRELAEWAEANIWEVPIDLPDALKEAADALEQRGTVTLRAQYRVNKLYLDDFRECAHENITRKMAEAIKYVIEFEEQPAELGMVKITGTLRVYEREKGEEKKDV